MTGYLEEYFKRINKETDVEKKIALLENLIVIVDDVDSLLSTRKEFLMGVWV